MLREANYLTIRPNLTNANALGHSVKYMWYFVSLLLTLLCSYCLSLWCSIILLSLIATRNKANEANRDK
jgi:uncharacterized membrane protein